MQQSYKINKSSEAEISNLLQTKHNKFKFSNGEDRIDRNPANSGVVKLQLHIMKSMKAL